MHGQPWTDRSTTMLKVKQLLDYKTDLNCFFGEYIPVLLSTGSSCLATSNLGDSWLSLKDKTEG